jgi:hypothetical protein
MPQRRAADWQIYDIIIAAWLFRTAMSQSR